LFIGVLNKLASFGRKAEYAAALENCDDHPPRRSPLAIRALQSETPEVDAIIGG